jgi:Xaa-Pro aminopeptidase
MTKQDLSFSVAEFKERLERVRGFMRAKELDLLILDEIEALSYVTGYGVSETLWRACAVPLEGEPFLMVRSLDVAPARERSWVTDILGFKDWQDPVAFFVREIERQGWRINRVGLDFRSHSMPLARFEQLRNLLPKTVFVDFGDGIWELRLKKSEAEIGYLRQAAAIADAAMAKAVKAVCAGGSQRDVAKAAASTYIELGADDGLVGPLTSGNDWDSLHGHLHSHALQPGAIVHIELVPRVREYSSRIMRSAIVGKATPEQRRIAETLIRLQDKQIAALKPGAVARDIDRIVREPLLETGLRPTYDNITGYTLGAYPYPTLMISDFNRIFTPTADWTVEAGMVVHMYTSAHGLAMSESILVTESGSERLTKTERTIFECS